MNLDHRDVGAGAVTVPGSSKHDLTDIIVDKHTAVLPLTDSVHLMPFSNALYNIRMSLPFIVPVNL